MLKKYLRLNEEMYLLVLGLITTAFIYYLPSTLSFIDPVNEGVFYLFKAASTTTTFACLILYVVSLFPRSATKAQSRKDELKSTWLSCLAISLASTGFAYYCATTVTFYVPEFEMFKTVSLTMTAISLVLYVLTILSKKEPKENSKQDELKYTSLFLLVLSSAATGYSYYVSSSVTFSIPEFEIFQPILLSMTFISFVVFVTTFRTKARIASN